MERFRKEWNQEKKAAIENGDVEFDGVPLITVLLYDGWSKRSSGHSYDAASGGVWI